LPGYLRRTCLQKRRLISKNLTPGAGQQARTDQGPIFSRASGSKVWLVLSSERVVIDQASFPAQVLLIEQQAASSSADVRSRDGCRELPSAQ